MVVSAAKHRQALRISSMLTDSFREMYRPESAMVRPQKVIRLLNQANVRFVVMGTHGIGGYRSEARATQAVDVLVSKRDHRKAVEAVRKGYPKLLVNDTLAVTRFSDPATDKVVIDLMKPVDPLYQLAFKNTVWVGELYCIPTLEMALAAKYAAMISPNRTMSKKYIDAGDFIDIVQNNYLQIDEDKLRKLGEILYRGGGLEVLKYVEDARAGKTLEI